MSLDIENVSRFLWRPHAITGNDCLNERNIPALIRGKEERMELALENKPFHTNPS